MKKLLDKARAHQAFVCQFTCERDIFFLFERETVNKCRPKWYPFFILIRDLMPEVMRITSTPLRRPFCAKNILTSFNHAVGSLTWRWSLMWLKFQTWRPDRLYFGHGLYVHVNKISSHNASASDMTLWGKFKEIPNPKRNLNPFVCEAEVFN